MVDDLERHRQLLVFIHARERDRQAWLAGGAKVSLAEHQRRQQVIDEAKKGDLFPSTQCQADATCGTTQEKP